MKMKGMNEMRRFLCQGLCEPATSSQAHYLCWKWTRNNPIKSAENITSAKCQIEAQIIICFMMKFYNLQEVFVEKKHHFNSQINWSKYQDDIHNNCVQNFISSAFIRIIDEHFHFQFNALQRGAV